MIDGYTVVLDAGKTNAKATLWDAKGVQVAKRSRANGAGRAAAYRSLDVAGIEAFLLDSLAEYGRFETVRRIVTVGHGAGAALLRDGRLYAEPMDYEQPIDDSLRESYRGERDPFSATGSPFLPTGLNLGLQLHQLERFFGPLPEDVTIVPWAQYWSWRLSGVAATEVSSLGCHTDLWLPAVNRYSALAERRGWATRMAPLRRAGDRLSTITPEVRVATGLPRQCEVLCGVHDSNAALLAARGHSELSEHDATVLSTGTWFVALRSIAAGSATVADTLDESRDCLLNVDVAANPVPSARFMGGREAELLGGAESVASPLARIPELIADRVCVFPSWVKGVGPFPAAAGGWSTEPSDPGSRRAAVGLYLALMADAALDLIGSRDRLLVEGRFAEDAVFVRALATIRSHQRLYVSDGPGDVAYGALRLVSPELEAPAALTLVKPLELDLTDYAEHWRKRTQQEVAE